MVCSALLCLLQVDPAALGSPNAALYVRAINRTPPAATGKDDKNKQSGKATFAWDNSYSSSVKSDGKLSRAIALPGGDYEMFIAIKDAGTGDKKQIPKMGLLRRNLTVPDFKKPELVTSSILVGNISPLEQRADMYVSTLPKYIEAMGGELDIIARFPEGAVRIRQFQELAADK